MSEQTVRSCGAERPALIDYGWECTGSGLVVIAHVTLPPTSLVARAADPDARCRVPVVLPGRALEIIDPEPWWDTPVVRFEGGDHLHLCVSRRPMPTGWRSDGFIGWGDRAVPFMDISREVLHG